MRYKIIKVCIDCGIAERINKDEFCRFSITRSGHRWIEKKLALGNKYIEEKIEVPTVPNDH